MKSDGSVVTSRGIAVCWSCDDVERCVAQARCMWGPAGDAMAITDYAIETAPGEGTSRLVIDRLFAIEAAAREVVTLWGKAGPRDHMANAVMRLRDALDDR